MNGLLAEGAKYNLPKGYDRDILLGTGRGSDAPEAWRKWIRKGRIENLRMDFRKMGIDEAQINKILGPPEGDRLGWR